MTENPRTLLVTGCSTGIGRHCAFGMRERGWRVLATARSRHDADALRDEGFETSILDYSDSASVAACAEEVLERTRGRLRALFNNGAYGQPGAVEDLPVDALRDQFEANFFGWHDLTRRLIPSMIALGGGRIVQNSSVLGLVALKNRGAYNASKFALEGLTDTMRLELADVGIRVISIEPGPIRSNFGLTARKFMRERIDVDASRHRDRYRAYLAEPPSTEDRDEKPTPASRFTLGPEAVLKKLIRALESPRPKPRYFVTFPTHMLAFARRILPSGMMRRFLTAIDR